MIDTGSDPTFVARVPAWHFLVRCAAVACVAISISATVVARDQQRRTLDIEAIERRLADAEVGQIESAARLAAIQQQLDEMFERGQNDIISECPHSAVVLRRIGEVVVARRTLQEKRVADFMGQLASARRDVAASRNRLTGILAMLCVVAIAAYGVTSWRKRETH